MEEYFGSINIKLSGELAVGGNVNLRDVAKALTHTQSMIDRAYLDVTTKGKVRKFSRLKHDQYGDLFFSVKDPKRESFLIDLASETKIGKAVIERINIAISGIYDSLDEILHSERFDIERNVERVLTQIDAGIITVQDYSEEEILKDKDFIRTFGDKSILKYLDQLVAPVRSDTRENFVEIGLITDRTYKYPFNRQKGHAFHSTITGKTLGKPHRFVGQLVKADWHNLVGDFVKYSSGRKCRLKFTYREQVEDISKFLGVKGVVIIACPIYEYDSYDPENGDLQFVRHIPDEAA